MKKKKSNYFNRELSWLKFNDRVLDLAFSESTPLLERLKFIAISGSNLDEFMMVRFGGLKVLEKSNVEKLDIAGFNTTEQIQLIRESVTAMYAKQSEALKELEDLLANEGIRRFGREDLSEPQLEFLRTRFMSEVVSTIAPIGIEPDGEFPVVSGARLSICVQLKNDPKRQLKAAGASDSAATVDGDASPADENRFAILPFPRSVERIWTVPTNQNHSYILIEEVIGAFLQELFPGQEIINWTVFRVTRNGDVELDEEGRDDLLIGMQELLDARKSSDCVRLEISNKANSASQEFLRNALEIDDQDVYRIEGPLALSGFFALAGIQGFAHLRDEPWAPQPAPGLGTGSEIFSNITESDRLLYHPYQSYDPVIEFIRAAAEDEQVIAIKQTLYRTARKSEIAEALCQAAAKGKHVTCIVELKARFDEARNIEAARKLESAGVDVIYGVRGLKTHAKVCIVVRKEHTGVKRYVHFATGNYNEATARLYSDASLFTCGEQLGVDAVHFFNAITGLSVPQTLGKLSAAPINLRETLLKLIQTETEHAKRVGSGSIRLKCNSLVDKEMIDAIYAASQAGVKVELNVRGICCLIPDKKGLSENVRVVSIVDRFLEHARIYYFDHGGDDRIFISSADLMGRNLDRRVELMVPVEDKDCKTRLMNILESYFVDGESAFELKSNGDYEKVEKKKKKSIRCQKFLRDEAEQFFNAHANPKTTVFQQHRREK
jgi:polyphosphate kinase